MGRNCIQTSDMTKQVPRPITMKILNTLAAYCNYKVMMMLKTITKVQTTDVSDNISVAVTNSDDGN